MRTIRTTLLASALLIAFGLSHGEAAAQFSGVYFFGDSLSDAGTFKPVLPPGTGKFTTNPGPVWVEVFAQRYGFTATPANQGGTDYAEGGARVALLPGVPPIPPTATANPVTVQVQNFLGKGAVDPGALYSVWAGSNDFAFQLGLAAAGVITSAQLQANLVTAATQLVQQVAFLNAAGARYIVVFNLPDLGRTPDGIASGQPATVTALASLFNSTLSAGLDSLHIDLIRLNVFALLNEAIANPAAFAGHQVIADYVKSVVEAPQKASLLAEAPLQVEQANFRALDGRMLSSLGAPRAQNKFDAYAIYDYGNYDRSGDFGGGDSQAYTVVVGGDMKLSDRLLAGIAFGYTEDKASFGDNGGGFKLNEATLTAYVGYGMGPWYVGGSVGAGDLDFRNVHRTITLGAGSRTESGTTHGTHWMGRILGGYWFNYGTWIHGPFARLTYEEAKVDAWSETGTSATAMAFGEQKRDALVSSLGWQASGNVGWVRPYARVTWEKDYNNDDRTVRAGLVSAGGVGFGLPALRPDDNYILFDIGASGEIGNSKITGFVSVNFTASKNDGNYQAITVGIRAPL